MADLSNFEFGTSHFFKGVSLGVQKLSNQYCSLAWQHQVAQLTWLYTDSKGWM